MAQATNWRNWLRPSSLSVILLLIYGLWLVSAYDTPYALATLGARYVPNELIEFAYSDEGYDGQSVYLIARYGWESEPFIDVPAYRMQRMLLPVIGNVIASSDAILLIWVLFSVNVLAVGLGTYVLERLLQDANQSVWLSIGYSLSLGIFGSARLLTTEPLAYALALLGIWTMMRERYVWGTVFFALAILGKETAVFFPMAYGLHWLWQRWFTLAFGMGIFTLLPFALWQFVLYQQVGEIGLGSGGELATSFEIVPFMGVIRILTEGSVEIFITLIPVIGLFVLLPTFWALWRVWVDFRFSRKVTRGEAIESQVNGWNIWTTILLCQVGIMLFVPFSTYREILGILRFIVGLQIAVILYSAHKKQKRALRYSTLWFLTSIFVILSDIGNLSA